MSTTIRTSGAIHVTRNEREGFIIYIAWEPSHLLGPHGVLMRIYGDDQYYGQVSSRSLPKEMVMSTWPWERVVEVKDFHDTNDAIARNAIFEAFGDELAGKPLRFDGGNIELLTQD